MSKKIFLYKYVLIIAISYILMMLLTAVIAEPQIKYESFDIEASDVSSVLGGICEGRTIRQEFVYEGTYLQKINLMSATYNRKNVGYEVFTLKNSDNEIIWQKQMPVKDVKNDSILRLQINKKIQSNDNKYALEITGIGNDADNSPTFYLTSEPAYIGTMEISDATLDGSLYMSIYGRIDTGIAWKYLIFVTIGLILISVYWCITVRKFHRGKRNGLIVLVNDLEKYKFLINQLVARDFKTKYKRSVLGILWSFLNPILTMTVQYIVFSTIFKSGIENFPVYLLSASILFNFFTESVGSGLGSITGNVSLLTKVSIPRYIYPISRVLSAGINLLMSTIPLFIVILLTGVSFDVSYILIPFVYLSLMTFCIGLSMLLATSMVFFRDTQFLWGIISLLWMYATPIFYPESIIPQRFSFVFKVNPIYYYLKFFRTILMEKNAPEMWLFGMCIFWSVFMLLIGTYFFRKNEKKFTLYI